METLKRSFLIIFIILLAHPLFSEAVQRKTLIFLNWTENQFSLPEKTILEQTLMTHLSEREITQFLQNPDNQNILELSDEEKDQKAVFAGADSWIEITLSGNMDEVSINWTIRDVQERTQLAQGDFTNAVDENFLTLYGSFWNPILSDVEMHLQPVEITGTLIVQALPGTSILGLSEEAIIIDESGEFQIRLSAPANYSIGLILEDYYDEQRRFYLNKDETKILEIDQKIERPFSLSLGLYMFAFPTVGIHYSIGESPFFVGGGIDMFKVGLVPASGDNDNESKFFNGMNISYVYLKGGIQPGTAKGYFRFPVAVGAFIRYTPHTKTNAILDPLSPWGLILSTGFDYKLKRNISLYLEWRPTFYYTAHSEIFAMTFEERFIQLGDYFFLDLPIIIVGFRWSP